MSDARPVDQPPSDALRSELEAWLNQQNQALLEEVIATWELGVARFRPTPALLDRLRALASPAALDLGSRDEGARQLAAALDLLEEATSQGDLLKRLLDALAPLVERSALFVVKQGLASLYAQRGFEADIPHPAGAVVPPADLEALIHGQARLLARKGPGYDALLARLSGLQASEALILPIRHKRKTVALLLADSGLRQRLDHPEQLRALTHATSAMLAALAVGRDDAARTTHGFDTTLPGLATQVVADPIGPPAGLDLDAKTRAAAERMARVLVGDVELYFPAKVAQARTQGGLYPLLREELDRSRATFVDRFGEEVEAHHRIFTTAVIQQLCDGDAAKLGAAPWA